jgi:DNA-binding NarL/FixJ family response regulator
MCSYGISGRTSEGHSNPDVRTRILIVDDDPAFRMMCEAAVRLDGLLETVASCGCAREAMAALVHGEIDVALVDIGLPDRSGVDVIRAIRRRQPRCDVMVISVFHDEEVVLRAIEAGATGYLLKDSAPPDIAGSIHALRAGGAPVSPMIARLLLDRLRSPDRAPQAAGTPPGALVLSEREIEILNIVARGLSLADVGSLLGISVNTVKTHVKRIYHKLAVKSRMEAVFEAQCMGLLRSASDDIPGIDDISGGRRTAGTFDGDS